MSDALHLHAERATQINLLANLTAWSVNEAERASGVFSACWLGNVGVTKRRYVPDICTLSRFDLLYLSVWNVHKRSGLRRFRLVVKT